MRTGLNLRRSAGVVAGLITTTAGGLALANPADATTGPSATLSHGTVTVAGSPVRDVIRVTIDDKHVLVDFGFDGTVDARFNRSRVERVNVLGAGGDDGMTVDGSGVGDLPIALSGGRGNDFAGVVGNIGDFGTGDLPVTLSGGAGDDDFLAAAPGPVFVKAGTGNDSVDGGGAGTGTETISLGAGNDKFVSLISGFISGGARNDIVDGGSGLDAMEMDGSFASESVGLSAKAGHLIVDHDFRDHIDADNVEDVSWFGFGGLDEGGGGDALAVNDLSGTDVVNFTPNFSAPSDGTVPNNSSDTLTVRGTPGVDHITVSGSGANITVSGLTPTVTPVLLDSKDFLRIDTLDGDDTVDSSGLQQGLVQLLVI